jgi:hypothetical protein
MPMGWFPGDQKNRDSQFCRRFVPGSIRKSTKAVFANKANNQTHRLLNQPGIVVLRMLQIRRIRPEWLIGCGF